MCVCVCVCVCVCKSRRIGLCAVAKTFFIDKEKDKREQVAALALVHGS